MVWRVAMFVAILIFGPLAARAGGLQTMTAEEEPGRRIGENMLEYRTGDDRIVRAALRAQETLPRFFELARAGIRGTYLVKMPLTHDGHTEHVWVEVTGFDGKRFAGLVANEPAGGGAVRMGDPVSVPASGIGDWMVNTGEVRYGGYSIRVMLADMPEAMAAQFRFRD